MFDKSNQNGDTVDIDGDVGPGSVVGSGSVTAEYIAGRDIIVNQLSPSEKRNRSRMLQKVRGFWVEGVLENSLHGAVLIELDKEYDPNAVEQHRPWDMILQQPEQPDPPEYRSDPEVGRRGTHGRAEAGARSR